MFTFPYLLADKSYGSDNIYAVDAYCNLPFNSIKTNIPMALAKRM